MFFRDSEGTYFELPEMLTIVVAIYLLLPLAGSRKLSSEEPCPVVCEREKCPNIGPIKVGMSVIQPG